MKTTFIQIKGNDGISTLTAMALRYVWLRDPRNEVLAIEFMQIYADEYLDKAIDDELKPQLIKLGYTNG